METILAIILGAIFIVLSYKILSAAIRLFVILTIAGLIIATIGKLFTGNEGGFASFSISIPKKVESTHSSCQNATKECIDELKKAGKIVLVIGQEPYCLVCKINELTVLHNNKFRTTALNNDVEIIFQQMSDVDSQYPEILQQMEGAVPFNIVFSQANPFGRSLNRIVTNTYLTQQIEEEASLAKIIEEQNKRRHKYEHHSHMQPHKQSTNQAEEGQQTNAPKAEGLKKTAGEKSTHKPNPTQQKAGGTKRKNHK